jgi:hypothetical protein
MRAGIWILSISLVGLISCGKYAPEDSINPFFVLLEEIREDGSLVTEFRYDHLNRLISLENYRDDAVVYSESYQYGEDNKLKSRIFGGFTETYDYYRDGRLKSVNLVYPATSKEWNTTYQYAGGRISRGITSFNGMERGYVEFKYDSKGNTIERSEYLKEAGQEDFLDDQFKIDYDDKVNPLKIPSVFPVDMVQKNNPVHFYRYKSVMSTLPIDYYSEYEYNDQGYPTTEIRNGITYSYHYRYRVNLDDLYFEHQMKGWELYSWNVHDSWFYSFLPGTNRVKSYEEVIGNPIIAMGVDSLKRMLDRFPRDEEIIWIGNEWLEEPWPAQYGTLGLPAQQILDEIKAHCLKRNLVLSITH